jgi:hypothetical protein
LFGKVATLFRGFGFRDESEEVKAKTGLKGLLEGLDVGKNRILRF